MDKILLIHNNYRLQGGEDIAVKNELNLLKENYEVKSIFFENEIKNIYDVISFLTFSNKSSNKKILDLVDEFQPDLVYFNNTWFKISLGIFKLLRKKNVKILIKIHNFRYHCTKSFRAYVHLDNENYCSACGFKKSKVNLINKYYSNSLLKSIFATFFAKKYMKAIKDESINLAVLTEFHKQFLTDNYSRKKNVFIIPNYISSNHSTVNEEDYFTYAGRLSIEKGVYSLIDSYLSSDLRNKVLKIIGDGPELKNLKEKYKINNIQFLGQLSNKETVDLISKSKAVLSATKLYEGQPTLLCEASLNGKASLFPDSGGINEFLPSDYEFIFEQFNYEDLKNKLNLLNNYNLKKTNALKAHKFIKLKLEKDNILNQFNQIIDKDD